MGQPVDVPDDTDDDLEEEFAKVPVAQYDWDKGSPPVAGLRIVACVGFFIHMSKLLRRLDQ